ncbi:hypothetical protein [Paracraurococcus ruber]|nr:hypothetical protein [Paracraurococcus ruber]
MKRAAFAAVPKAESWTLRLFTLERTAAGEQVEAGHDRRNWFS